MFNVMVKCSRLDLLAFMYNVCVSRFACLMGNSGSDDSFFAISDLFEDFYGLFFFVDLSLIEIELVLE